jgi:hypothetical protein
MAGAGYKLFATGDVLTAAEVNTYLQQQVTMVFADSTARTTALSGVLAEGMMSYLQDTNTVEVYNGSNWVNVGNTGDVTEVQAGTGISVADGTGPIPIVTNTMATEITAKGDLIVGTGSGTFDNLPAGTNGFTLVADSAQTTGLKWAAPASGSMTLLSTITLSGTSTGYTSITTGYKFLRLIGTNITNSSDAYDLDILVNNGTTGVYLSGTAKASATDIANGKIPISANSGLNANAIITFVLDIYNYDSSSVEKVIILNGLMVADYLNTIQPYSYGGTFKSNTAITSLYFSTSTGTMSGTALAYGVN